MSTPNPEHCRRKAVASCETGLIPTFQLIHNLFMKFCDIHCMCTRLILTNWFWPILTCFLCSLISKYPYLHIVQTQNSTLTLRLETLILDFSFVFFSMIFLHYILTAFRNRMQPQTSILLQTSILFYYLIFDMILLVCIMQYFEPFMFIKVRHDLICFHVFSDFIILFFILLLLTWTPRRSVKSNQR